jgi:hypothetical protein
MKIRVQHEDGTVETLTLVPPIQARLGVEMSHIQDATGTDFFFGAEGHYDGWGRSLLGSNMTTQQAGDLIREIESSREIEGEE